MEVGDVEVCGHRVTFCGVRGASVDKLRKILSGLNLGSIPGAWYK